MRKTKSLQEVIKQWMKNSGKEALFFELKIKEKWRIILGDKIYSKTLNISWVHQEKLLLIHLNDPILKNELNYAKESIKQKLLEQIPELEIKKIVIV